MCIADRDVQNVLLLRTYLMDKSENVPRRNDASLIAAIAHGNERALSAFYDRHARLVFGVALGLVGDRHAAEEVAGDAFFRVWTQASRFDARRGSPLAWLVTITRHLAIDYKRSRQGRFGERAVSLDVAGVGASGTDAAAVVARQHVSTGSLSPSPEKSAAAAEVHGVVAALDSRYRAVITLSYFEGMSHAMIAERLNLPLGTVKSRLREAVVKLRRQLGAQRKTKP